MVKRHYFLARAFYKITFKGVKKRTQILTASLSIYIFFVSLVFAESKKIADYEFSIKCDRPDANYKIGEEASFTFALKKSGVPVDGFEFEAEISKDGVASIKKLDAKTNDEGKAVFKGSLNEAGFLRCTISFKIPQTEKFYVMIAGAAYEPLKISPSLPVPADFESYWKKQREILDSVPMNLTIKKRENYNKAPVPADIELYEVIADTYQGKIYAFMSMPKDAKPKSLPAVVIAHGAGVRGSQAPVAMSWAKMGFLALDFNANGVPNDLPSKTYMEMRDNELKEYYLKGLGNRDTMFFRFLFMRLMRAMDILTSQPQWDEKVLVSYGRSQGGGQAIAAAGLDKRVTLIVSHIAAICDHSGVVVGRANGWPRVFSPVAKDGSYDKKIVEEARYVDAMNFAAITNAEAFFSLGYADKTCPPTSTFAAYNNIKNKKELFVMVEAGHSVSAEATEAGEAAALKHVEQMKKNN